MKRRLVCSCLLAMLASATVAAQSQIASTQPASPDRTALLEGVKTVGVPGVVGQIAVWGDDAFAIVVGKDGDARVPIIAASRYGKGRVIACAHGFASGSGVKQLDTGAFIRKACDWLGGESNQPLRVGLLKCDLGKFLQGHGIDNIALAGGEDLASQLKSANVRVVLCNEDDLSDAELRAIDAFVRDGGGFLCCACPWGWAQVRKKDADDIPLNRLLRSAGLAYTDGTADETQGEGFDVTAPVGEEFSATGALRILQEAEAGARGGGRGGRTPRDPIVVQAGATLRHVASALPADDQLVRPALAALLAERAELLAPSPQKPLGRNRPLDRALLALQVADIEALPVESVRAHPSAAAFPGAVADDAPRVSRDIAISARPLGWRSTGLYAAPGEIITLTLNADDLDAAKRAALRVRIGCHRDELWKLDRWQRVPRITRTWPLDAREVRIASAFGGPIYIEVPSSSPFNPLTIAVSGAVEAPLFILGETTSDQWLSHLRDRPGPWAELVSDRVSLSIPSSVARTIDDPQAVMEHWVKVLDADADLAGISRERAKPERFVADVQISAGYMHSGYPIMTHLDAATFMTDLVQLKQHGWGPYHELGHNHQQGEWTFAGTTEVTCNLFTLYVMEMVCGTPPAQSGRVLDDKSFNDMRRHLETDGRWERWKREPFIALQMYALMQRGFGWDAFKKVFAEYRDLPADQRPKNDDQKRDQWLTRFSRTVQRDLGPYFEAWGVPTSSAARASLRDLPVWMPVEMQSYAK